MDEELKVSPGISSSKGNCILSPLKISREVQFPSFRSPRSPPLRSITEVESVKCVIVGDAEIGKTSLVTSFLFEEFSKSYMSTVRDDYTFCTTMAVPGRGGRVDVDLDICDTGGQSYLDRLRPLCYGDGLTSPTGVTIICFSVVVPSSFVSVVKRWVPELKRHCPNFNKNMKIILVGTQSDLRSNVNILLSLMEDGLSPVSEARAMRLAKKIGAVKYIECSSLNGFNVKRVFETAIYSNIITTTSTTPPSSPPTLRTNNIDGTDVNVMMTPKSDLEITSKRTQPALETGRVEQAIIRSTNKLNSTNGDPRLFWRRWRLRQKSNKIKRLMLSCLH